MSKDPTKDLPNDENKAPTTNMMVETLLLEVREGFAEVRENFAKVNSRFDRVDSQIEDLRRDYSGPKNQDKKIGS
jgi:hypothetical protein